MPLRVLQLTDLHLYADPGTRLKGIPTQQMFRDVLSDIAARHIVFDYAIVTGDLAQEGELGAYAFLIETLGDRLSTCRFIPGNHDRRPHLRSAFGTAIAGKGPITFALDAGGWRLVGLDTLVPGSGAGRIAADQLVWLEETLASARGRPVALFMHHPPIPVGTPWLDRIGLQAPDAFAELLSAFPNVEVVCCGHVHQEFEGSLGGIPVLAAPSTCLQFEPGTESPVFTDEPPGFRLLELSPGEMTTEVFRLPETRHPPAV